MNISIEQPIKIIAFLMSTLLIFASIACSIPVSAEEASTEGIESTERTASTESTESTERTPSGIFYNQLEQEIDKYVDAYVGKSSPGAAIVVTRGDEMIFSKGYGYANIENQVPVDSASTVFDYGSINKLFVWTSVMQLEEEGKLKLDQDIRAYLPKQFAAKLRYDKAITMLDIMSHTAGFEQHPLALFTQSPEKLKSLEETLLSPQPKQIYEPGKVIAYSNYATALAAYVVEEVSGVSFSDYEMNRILRPLGMNHTSGHPKLEDHLELQQAAATGYGITENDGFEARAPYFVPLYPAGAMKGTAEDLARFAMALTAADNQLFVNKQTLQTMLTQSYTPNKDILSNAHGLWEYTAQPGSVGHAGNTMGFSSNFVVVPEEKLGIVVLTNAEVEQEITSGIIDLLIQSKTQEVEPTVKDLPNSKDVAGHYVLSGSNYSTIQEVMSYLGLIKIEAKGEHDLSLTVMGMSGDYKQTSPNVYKMDKTGHPAIQKIAPILYAEKSEGKVIRLSKGKATDVLPLKRSRSFPLLIIYLIVAVIAIAFFLLTPVVLLIRWLLRKRKGITTSSTANRLFAALIVFGTALVLNVLFMLWSFVINQSETAVQLNIGVLVNWVLAILAILLLVVSSQKSREAPQSRGQKWFRLVTTEILLSFLFILYDWNFFHLVV
ncbi:serine hydrolase domain-containing protein [Paenibacillus eucommiae]|uniref:CubicO group peptidase (Beta-lactamase class C family) n=1 Tax=Paenibacillus eucommiae TaxID=1355755 RepID=A0ABS4J9W6_9BACL|nr:serine hydrolase domain-containing protein [Paenibacillus eucommiae]MBP1995519.1 CubicO group peptidase (beta-lactamase class C family) [Paenibacillus eucommiae]